MSFAAHPVVRIRGAVTDALSWRSPPTSSDISSAALVVHRAHHDGTDRRARVLWWRPPPRHRHRPPNPHRRPTPPVTAGWNEGFFLQTPERRQPPADRIRRPDRRPLRPRRSACSSPTRSSCARRGRRSRGRVARYVDFKLMPELAGSVTLLDGYVDIRFSPQLRLRSGKDKTPVGYELLIGDAGLVLFPERSRRLAARAESRRRVLRRRATSPAGKLRLCRRHLQRQPGRWQSSTDRRGHQQRQGPRRPHRRAARSERRDAGPRAEQLRLPPRRIDRRPDRGAPVVADHGAARPSSRFRQRTADGRRNRVSPAVFLYVRALRRLRRVRAHDAGRRDERRRRSRSPTRPGE